MDSLEGRDLNGVFKAANFAVASLAVLSGISQLFSGIQSFIIGLYIIAFGSVIGFLAYTYGSFLFSFIGRGIFYTLIGASINGASWFRILTSLLIFIIGLVYIALEAIPSISPPENMNPESIAIGVQDEDIV